MQEEMEQAHEGDAVGIGVGGDVVADNDQLAETVVDAEQ